MSIQSGLGRTGGALRAWTMAALFLAQSACSGGGSTNGGPSADTACADSARAMCTKMQACAPANIERTYGDEPTCESRVKATCLDSLAAPLTGNTAEKAEACAQAFANYACADYRNKTNVPMPCLPAQGKRLNGAECLYAGQCRSAFCAIVPGTPCGSCADTPDAGDSCAQLTSCGATLTCTTDTLVCTSPAAQGEACQAGQPCGAGLTCVAPGGAGTAGTCQPSGAQVGATCDPGDRTGPGCDGALSLYCDGVTKQCAQMTYAGAGQACGYNVDAGSFVACAGGSCQGSDPSQMQPGTCGGRAADEGACTVPDGGESTPTAGCLPPARCIESSGTCQVVQASSCL
jgi:hypothetical protein